MLRTYLFSKIHRATVTDANLDYIGSLSLDEDLMDQAGMREYEQVHIADLDNGERLTTYLIRAPRGSRTVGINGAAAHKVRKGDKIIIFAYAQLDQDEAEHFRPTLVFVDEQNRIVPGPAIERHGQTL